MTEKPPELDLLAGKPMSLATIDIVKTWRAKGVPFKCQYDLVDFTRDGKARYRCIYLKGEACEPFVLVSTRLTEQGAQVRLFNIWPGIFKHHLEFGDGRDLCFDRRLGLRLVDRQTAET